MANFKFEKGGSDVTNLVMTPSDFVNGQWHSDEKSIQNVDRMTLSATYSDLLPDGANVNVDYRLKVTLEGKESDGTWSALVNQFSPIFSSEQAPTRRLIATNRPTSYDPNTSHIIADALGNETVEISVEDIDIPDLVRVCIELGDRNTGAVGLTSFGISLNGRSV